MGAHAKPKASSGLGDDVDLALVAARVLQRTIAQGEQRIVAATTDVLARMEVSAALTDDDIAGLDLLSGEHLATKALRM